MLEYPHAATEQKFINVPPTATQEVIHSCDTTLIHAALSSQRFPTKVVMWSSSTDF